MTRLFMDALQVNPNDPDLLTSIGVLKFIDKDYRAAEPFFEKALKEDPTNYSLWNKLGAAKANYSNYPEGIEVYH